MRIIYTFRKKHRFWIVNCPSDKSIKESIYNSLIEAINHFFGTRDNIEYFDIVIPSTIPNPIPKAKRIHRIIPVIRDKIIKPITPINVVYQNDWGNKPIPESTIEFKYGMKWVVVIPPYGKQNIYYIQNPLPGTSKIATGKGSVSKTIQMINGTLEHDVFIDFGWSKARIYPDGQDLKIEFTGGQKAVNDRWLKAKSKKQVKPKHPNIFDRFKQFFIR